jgi:calcineurin-like phosphoesterase family protein
MNFNQSNIFFISDLHIGHANVIKFDGRPFETLEEMHESILKEWNSKVKSDDVVFLVGDLYFGDPNKAKEFYKKLKGRIFVIKGNHDKMETLKSFDRFERIWEYGTEIFIKDPEIKGKMQRIVLSHYPILEWNQCHRGAWHLHGHTHGHLLSPNPEFRDFYYSHKVLDIGCMNIQYGPISYTELKEIMSPKKIWQHH